MSKKQYLIIIFIAVLIICFNFLSEGIPKKNVEQEIPNENFNQKNGVAASSSKKIVKEMDDDVGIMNTSQVTSYNTTHKIDNFTETIITSKYSRPITYSYQIIDVFPHDTKAFTQGLIFHDGFLYESMGDYGKSKIVKRDLTSGEIYLEKTIPEQYFAEGLTIYKDKLILLTWQSNVGFVFNLENFKLFDQFDIAGEGWGLTFDGEYLILSDGSSTLFFLDPETYQVQFHINVTDGDNEVTLINELEYINGMIFANNWLTSRIAIIDPMNGNVKAWIELGGLEQMMDISEPKDVLNGIAYDVEKDRLFVTGKYWPNIFEIKLAAIKDERFSED